MPVIIRQIVGHRFKNFADVNDSWDLRTQVKALEEWMDKNAGLLDPSSQWVADIGFAVRLDATGGGPPISLKLMQSCVARNLEIYLSEYGADPGS